MLIRYKKIFYSASELGNLRRVLSRATQETKHDDGSVSQRRSKIIFYLSAAQKTKLDEDSVTLIEVL